MTEEENIELLKLSRIINKFVEENKVIGWYAPDLARVIIKNGFKLKNESTKNL